VGVKAKVATHYSIAESAVKRFMALRLAVIDDAFFVFKVCIAYLGAVC